MIRRESKFQTLFRHWARKNLKVSAAFELKQTQIDYLSFSAVQEHQVMALQAAKGVHGILYKAPDDSRGIKPFDMFYLRYAKAYVVIRYPKFFCLIDIDDFTQEKERSVRSSLTSKRAREIAEQVVEIK